MFLLELDCGNRRAAPRVPFHTLVEFRLWGDEVWLTGFSFDLSETGVFVRTLAPLLANKPVEVRFRLTDEGEALTSARAGGAQQRLRGAHRVLLPLRHGGDLLQFPVAE